MKLTRRERKAGKTKHRHPCTPTGETTDRDREKTAAQLEAAQRRDEERRVAHEKWLDEHPEHARSMGRPRSRGIGPLAGLTVLLAGAGMPRPRNT